MARAVITRPHRRLHHDTFDNDVSYKSDGTVHSGKGVCTHHGQLDKVVCVHQSHVHLTTSDDFYFALYKCAHYYYYYVPLANVDPCF